MADYTYRTNLLFSVGGNQEHEPELRLTYSVTPGAPATGPTYDCGGEPGYGPEVDLHTALVKVGDDWIALPEWMFGILYSETELQNELLDNAADDDEYARDQAADARREEAFLERGQ